ncbi:MerR family transcriptional regulator [Nocardia altamirensis]|uniref:MerR family transcriptional regulator n=1 Tax=Nocardia altamirensis TaxID=472158 RepID=UPI0008400628|nr:MerR family transcriptional regulator [Nocardia altamirensis]
MTSSRQQPESGGEFTVGVVARTLGIPVATLRSWNQRYGLPPGWHRPGKHRLYTRTDVAIVGQMVALVRAGMSPASAARVAGAVPVLGDVAPVLDAAQQLDSAALLAVLTAHMIHHGVIDTWNRLCRPAFAEIVGRQERGGGFIDVEHHLSWAVATSLHRVIPPPQYGAGQVPVLLACTTRENHALPLEVLRAALAERGILAVFLGQSMPESALADAVSRPGRAPVVVLWSQSNATADLGSVGVAQAGASGVVAAGPGWYGGDLPTGIQHVNSLEDAVERVARLACPV